MVQIREHDFKPVMSYRFGRASATYDQFAGIQRRSASLLRKCWQEFSPDLPPGEVLEFGCGTGILTRLLLEDFAGRKFVISDVSEKMVECARASCGVTTSTEYLVSDAEQINCQSRFALAASNFVIHWFSDLSASLSRISRSLKDGGYLFCTSPVAGSFPEWQRLCLDEGIKYTANSLPDVAELVNAAAAAGLELAFAEHDLVHACGSFRDALRAVKGVGATASKGDSEKLTSAQLRRLLEKPGEFSLTYRVAVFSMRKCG